jgi:hypothetical protein
MKNGGENQQPILAELGLSHEDMAQHLGLCLENGRHILNSQQN